MSIATGVSNVDRIQCSRVVPMRLLALGLSRTGTNSLRTALEILGYNQTYHGYSAAFENPRDCDMWLQAMSAKFDKRGKRFGRAEFDQLLGHCQAVTDVPAVCFAQELIEAYPEAQVILTWRDVDVWYESVINAIITHVYSPWAGVVSILAIIFRSSGRWSRPMFRRVWEDYFEGFRLNGKRRYKEHYELVESLVPVNNLLYYQVQEGWEPLCRFLNQPIPDVPFPKGNEVAETSARIKALVKYEAAQAGWRLLYIMALFVPLAAVLNFQYGFWGV
ncbi:hypothetical protein N7456_002552 [Penicillium angulare]|uniref:NAD dependent epimerase/dehydratase n=1 Tax=Penicillium angulare TaxID=116970 RepID=A0A9W9G8W7_9EURO|nr:hypothetical protein N7456_002552 [Penicillium angulare]